MLISCDTLEWSFSKEVKATTNIWQDIYIKRTSPSMGDIGIP